VPKRALLDGGRRGRKGWRARSRGAQAAARLPAAPSIALAVDPETGREKI